MCIMAAFSCCSRTLVSEVNINTRLSEANSGCLLVCIRSYSIGLGGAEERGSFEPETGIITCADSGAVGGEFLEDRN